MSTRFQIVLRGLAWVILSPLAVLMALIAKPVSLPEYYAHVMVFGAWSALGVVSGLATMATAPWASQLQRVLRWAAFAYFAAVAAGLVLSLGASLLMPQVLGTRPFEVAAVVVAILSASAIGLLARSSRIRQSRVVPAPPNEEL